jgi:CheY-like chemotaxis protein
MLSTTLVHRGLDRKTRPAPSGILIVDDEPMVRNVLRIALGNQRFAVWVAADGHEAIHLYRQHRAAIALVLLDVRMPGLDGPQTLAALQALNPAIVCCFMTGHAGDYREAELLEQGASQVFAKPFALDVLGSHLRRLAAAA